MNTHVCVCVTVIVVHLCKNVGAYMHGLRGLRCFLYPCILRCVAYVCTHVCVCSV